MKSRRIILFLIILSYTFISIQVSTYAKDHANPLNNFKNYIVYYGDQTTEAIEVVSNYDFAIVEAKAWTKSEIIDIQQDKTMLYGYISLMEVERYDTDKVNTMNDDDYLYIEGEKVYIPTYKNYLGDISNENYQDILIEIIGKRVVDKGFSGVFLDTVGQIDDYDKKVDQDLTQGYIAFLKKLNTKYPNLSIIQNRSFETYKKGSSKYIDGLMYEDFKINKYKTSEYYEVLIDKLIQISNEDNVKIMAISHENEEENYEFCEINNWAFFYNKNGAVYDELVTKKPVVKTKQKIVEVEKNTDFSSYKRIKMFLVSKEDVEESGLENAILYDDKNEAYISYDKYVLDINNNNYKDYLINKIDESKDDVTGIWFAYVTTLNKLYKLNTDTYEEQLRGYKDFLKELKIKYPELKIIQNRGLNILDEDIVKYLDGVYWENFDENDPEDEWFNEQIENLANYSNNLGWEIFIKSNSWSNEIANICENNGFIKVKE